MIWGPESPPCPADLVGLAWGECQFLRAWVVGLILGCAAPVLAQSQPQVEPKQPEIVIDVKQPEREWSTGVEKPPPGPGREAFDAQAISVDAILNEVKRGGKPLPASDFYRLVNRPDLVAWSEGRTRQRIWLISSGTIIAVAGVVSGIIVMGTGPDTSSSGCQTSQYQDYTNCLDQASRAQMTGAFILGASLAVGGVLYVWGMNIPEMVTPADQTLKMATEYNQALAVRHGASAPSSGVRFQLLPAVAPGYAGLTAKLTF
ncbi:MAG TPA: hypothetical protein VLT82_10200 [Myxococcaceae bacterium]|nr:hypothetical protein [Myxococcaceae bacterium]